MFSGYFIDPKGPVFSLTSEDGQETRWVSLGETFAGYKLTAFDQAAQKLTLTRANGSVEIRLRTAHIEDAGKARRAYLKTLRGLPLAQELAKDGDAQLGDLLQRRQQAIDAPSASQKSKFALEYLEKRIEEVAAARAEALAKEH